MAWVERQLVSLDWDVRTLRVVHFTMGSKGGVRIRKVLSVALPSDMRAGDSVAFGQLIRRVLERERIGARRMVVDVPHIVKVAGIDHVGLGSDFDGIGKLPAQLEDVSKYPYITQELLNRGYKPEDIRRVLGGNALRALRDAETGATNLKKAPNVRTTRP